MRKDVDGGMRILSIDVDLIGEKLGHSIFDERGRVLLAAGVTLSERSINQLLARGYRSVPVRDPLVPDAMPTEAIDQQIRTQTTVVVVETLRSVEQRGVVVVDQVRRAIDLVLANVMKNAALAVHLSNLSSVDNNMLVHSVNVAVYSVILAHSLSMPRDDIKNIGIGALLHDIGKIYYMDLVKRSWELTPDEQQLLQQHTTDGYELLRRQRDIDIRIAHVAYQHHERLDGSGYPRGLQDDRIHRWAQVVAIADVLENLVANGPGHEGMAYHEAMDAIRDSARLGQFDDRTVRHLVRRLAAFPEGTIVLLETGEVSVVTAQNKGSALEASVPTVLILTDRHLNLVEPAARVANGTDPGTTITSVLPDYPPRVYEQLKLKEVAGVPTLLALVGSSQ